MSDAKARDAIRRRFELLCVPHSADLTRFVYWLCRDRTLAAKWFGYPTFWNNRQSAAPEALGVMADAAGATLSELLRWLHVTHEP